MRIVARRQPGTATLDDLLAIPEERRHHELIAGTIVEKSVTSARHGGAQTRLGRSLGPFDRRPGGPHDRPGGWWFASEVEIDFEPGEAYRPDLAGWRRERLPALPSETPVRVVPDWICEVLSTNRRHDLVTKKRVYHRHRVAHYWIVDPEAEALLVNRWGADGFIEVLAAERGDRIRAEPFEAIELAVGVLFGDDED